MTSIGCELFGNCSSVFFSGSGRPRRQLLTDEQIGHFLELRFIGEVEDVVTAIVQVVARAADGAERGVPGRYAGERN
jgi:hypothetical protein